MRKMATTNHTSVLLHAGIVLLAVCLLATGVQALRIPMDDADLAAGADTIVQGTITSVQSQWNAERTGIVTTAMVTVKSHTKGAGPDTFTLTVPGGTADGITEWVEDQPTLTAGTDAFIFVKSSEKWGPMVFGGNQGLVPIHQGTVLLHAKGGDSAVTADAYERYMTALAAGGSPTPPQPNVTVRIGGTAPAITSVSPGTASAGTETIVTIIGSDFGTKGSRESLADVLFTYNPTMPIYASGYPFYDVNADDIVSWSDTQIDVKVPVGRTQDNYAGGSASSGHLSVRTDAGVRSGDYPFTVTFSYGKARWNGPVRFSINPDSLPAITAIESAARTWNATNPTSSFQFSYLGISTGRTIARDDQNLICFLPASEFYDPNTLSETSIWFDNLHDARIFEADIKFNEGYSWTTGTASGSTYNIESVALHELGHVLGLLDLYGYSSSPRDPTDVGKVMFGIMGDQFGNMNQKALHADDIAGILWIYSGPAPVPGSSDPPTDTDGDGKYDDVNGNGVTDFNDVVVYFNQMEWIAANEPVTAFDYNRNGEIDFNDVVWLFNRI